ncbi:M20/M25/M40 family metallo-hydrolase [Terrimonas pollutisoli]|uniref:M20/M25/M40 family metallo-hydrolase n=1 Tax=Terrimonas pollutisoli TaxID=3034147 RepID=UPI0023EAD580|nr:M20/M25/M40 family metallo-hydrolase [Terrimonas sp. H1YJ31]
MRGILFFCILLATNFVVSAQKEDSLMIRRIADEILLNGKAYNNLHYLTKQIGARLAGSPGMVKAEQWGFKIMQESGAEKTWLQECMVPHWMRGGKDEAGVLNFQSSASGVGSNKMTRKLDVVALGNSVGTGPKGVVDNVVLVNSFEDLEKKKDLVNGKIVFYNYKFNDAYVNTFWAYRDAAKYRSQGPSLAAKYGAAAVIIRSMSNSVDNNPHTGATNYDSGYAKMPAVAIGLRDADWLAAELEKRQVTVYLKTNGKMLPDTIGHNVIGELTGSEFPDEIITIGGHIDSWDNCEGAHDDGAGCVQTVEVLRAFKAIGYKPKRTIRFVLFANEENGLRGGVKYAEEAKAKNEKHVFALESDAGGFTPRGFGFTLSDEQFAKVMQWKPLIAPYGAGDFVKGGGGADIGPLSRTFGTPVAGLNPDTQRYFDIHHARNDVFENVNKRELELGAVNMAALIYLVDKYGL